MQTLFDGFEIGTSIRNDFDSIMANAKKYNAEQAERLRNLHPEGYYDLVDHNGKVLQRNFFCSKCKLEQSNAPDLVAHCGRVSRRPQGRLQEIWRKTQRAVEWL